MSQSLPDIIVNLHEEFYNNASDYFGELSTNMVNQYAQAVRVKC